MAAFKMPERQPGDTSINVRKLDNGYFRIWYDGDTDAPYAFAGAVVLSPYNTARLFGMLALFLGIELGKKLAKAIIIFPPGKESTIEFRSPEPKTLGERIAQALVVEKAPAQIHGFTKVTEPPRCVHGTNPPSMCEHSGCHPRKPK